MRNTFKACWIFALSSIFLGCGTPPATDRTSAPTPAETTAETTKTPEETAAAAPAPATDTTQPVKVGKIKKDKLQIVFCFGQSNMVLQAAMAGLGVALGRSALVADDLAEGGLVRPFGPAVPSGFAYYIVCPHQTAESHKVAAFRAWLKDEAGRF